MKWRRNLFDVPRSKAGTLFVQEITHFIDAYSQLSAMGGCPQSSYGIAHLATTKATPHASLEVKKSQLK